MDFGELMMQAVKNRQSSTAKIRNLTMAKKEVAPCKPSVSEKEKRAMARRELLQMEQRAAEHKRFLDARRKEKAEQQRQRRLEQAKPPPPPPPSRDTSTVIRNSDRQNILARERAMSLLNKNRVNCPPKTSAKQVTSGQLEKANSLVKKRRVVSQVDRRPTGATDFEKLMKMAEQNLTKPLLDFDQHSKKPTSFVNATERHPLPPTSLASNMNAKKAREPLKMNKRSSFQIVEKKKPRPIAIGQLSASKNVAIVKKSTGPHNKRSSVDNIEEEEQRLMRIRRKMLIARRIREEEEEEQDSDIDDFIDDSEATDLNVTDEIRKIFKYNPEKYKYLDCSDDRNMEASYEDICREEAKSTRLALMEDMEELKREKFQMNAAVVELVEQVVKLLQTFSYDLAKEMVDEFRIGSVALSCCDDAIVSLIQCLSLLTTAEKGYGTFTFLASRGFLRKESGTRSVYNLIRSDLFKYSGDSSSNFETVADVDEKTVVCHLLRQLYAFASSRVHLMNCYEKLASLRLGHFNDVEEVAESVSQCLRQYSGAIHHPMIGPLQFMFTTECEVLLQLLKCQLSLSNLEFVESLAFLREAQYRLNSWTSETTSTTTSSPMTSWFVFKQTSKPKESPALRVWFQKFYELLFSKFSLYFYTVLSRQTNAKELFNCMSKVPHNYSIRIASFCRKNDVIHFCLILNTTNMSHGQWSGYKMPTHQKTASGLENFPIIFAFPPEKPSHLLPSIVMLLSDNADKLRAEDRICSSHDPHKNRSYIVAHVEGELSIVLVTKRTKNEKNQVIMQFVNELCCELRCASLFQSLKTGLK